MFRDFFEPELGQISDRRALWRREVIAGITVFLSTAYIVALNPSILHLDGKGIPYRGALTATVLVIFTGTFLMGFVARLPYVVCPGLGVSAFFAYTLCLDKGIPWQIALGVVFWSGVVFLIASLTPLRETIVRAIPKSLRVASAVGIGGFLLFIGLFKGKLIADHEVHFVTYAKLSPEMVLTGIGVVVILAFLARKKSPFAFIAGMAVVTVISLLLGKSEAPESLVAPPDFSSAFLQLDIRGAIHVAMITPLFIMLTADLIDSLATFVGLSQSTGQLDEKGDPIRLREGLAVDAVATFSAGIFGSSSGTTFIESASGLEVGGRTWRTAVVTAVCFLPFLFLAPMLRMIPDSATSAILIVIGALMFPAVKQLDFDKIEDWFPAVAALWSIPLTFSITYGVIAGFLSHTVLYLFAGRWRDIHPMMYGIALCSVALIIVESLYK